MSKPASKKITASFNAPAPQKQFPITLETPRLMLRELEPSDAKRLQEITSAKGFVYYCFDGTQAKVDAFLKDAVDTRKIAADGNRTEVMLGIVLKETGELIGHVSLQRVHYFPGYSFDTNFFVDMNYQNKGYGREAIINIMKYGYEEMKLPGYTISTHPDNKASLAVSTSEGYKVIGETKMQTAAGEEPRLILLQTKETFDEQRKHDKRPLLLEQMPNKKAANTNTPPKGPSQG